MSFSQLHDFLEEQSDNFTEFSDGTFSIELDSKTTNFEYSAFFTRTQSKYGDVRVTIVLPIIGKAPESFLELCAKLHSDLPKLSARFDSNPSCFRVATTISSDNFPVEMSEMVRICDGLSQLLRSGNRYSYKEFLLAATPPLGTA